ncbi:MAG: exodeoxyribonuclease VII large subunit [Clostridia bacterium]|nr:exodeoxyribonuclease VII large subunit [Clostridia bacterium]
MEENIVTVTQLNTYVKTLIEYVPQLNSVWVKGEISNFKHHSSGHMYLTLKDENSVIKAVMFRGNAYSLNFMPENGMKILAHGRVSVYERDGIYQLYIDKMEPDGVGALYIAYEQLKSKLEAEGLFDERYKKPIPKLPSRVGVITSPTGAAVRDIINVISRRCKMCDVVLYPVTVQGEGSAEKIAEAIEYFNKTKSCDVIITGRGGGSIEDLWEFNKEITARAIFGSEIPVISAVGHETDFTIADFVADLRAPTPSAAAELAVPSLGDITNILIRNRGSLDYAAANFLKVQKAKLDNLADKVSVKGIYRSLDNKRMYIDSLLMKCEKAVSDCVSLQRERLGKDTAKLQALSPLNVIARGYTLATDETGNVVTSIKDVKKDSVIELCVSDGKIISRVTDVTERL